MWRCLLLMPAVEYGLTQSFACLNSITRYWRRSGQDDMLHRGQPQLRLRESLYIFLPDYYEWETGGGRRVVYPLSSGHLPVALSVTKYITTNWRRNGSGNASPTHHLPCFCSKLYTPEAIADDADIELLCKMANISVIVFVHSLIPVVESCDHYLRPEGHNYMNAPDVTLRCIICTTLSLYV